MARGVGFDNKLVLICYAGCAYWQPAALLKLMKTYTMFEWLLLLFTPVSSHAAPEKDYIGMVAAEAAYVALLPDTPVTKPIIDTKDCKRCDGKGKIPTGDSNNPWTDCPDCELKEGGINADAAPPRPSMKLQVKPLPPVKSGDCPIGACPYRRA